MAGGRLSGKDAEFAGTTIKALAELSDEALVVRVVRELKLVPEVGRIVVVGPDEVRKALGDLCEVCTETKTLLGNVQAGVKFAGLTGSDRVLLVGSDLAFPCAESFSDFIQRTPESSDVTTPLVTRAAYDAAFPNIRSAFVALREGDFTIGSQFTSPAGLLLDPPPGVEAILGNRKSQVQMAISFGPMFVTGLLTKSLTIPALEKRASEILRVSTTAVRDCAADLAFDIDDRHDLAEARAFIN